jgi:hypothetical protein
MSRGALYHTVQLTSAIQQAINITVSHLDAYSGRVTRRLLQHRHHSWSSMMLLMAFGACLSSLIAQTDGVCHDHIPAAKYPAVHDAVKV